MIGIDYENMDDLTHLDDKTKLKIVKIEISKISSLNELLYNALKYHDDIECAEGFIYASFLIDSHIVNIQNLFPN